VVRHVTVTLFVRFVQAAGEYFLGCSLGLGPLKACILSRSLPLLHRLGPCLGLHLLVGHGVGGRIECVMLTADVVHRAPGDGLGSMGTAAVFQLGQATVHKPA
jgi:hypothetical protein